MLILTVSDLHGEVDWLIEVIERHRPDLLLSPGDWGDPGQVSEAQYGALIDRVHVLTVYGNHDDRAMLQRLQNRDGTPVLLGQGETRTVGAMGLTVAGISGIWAKTTLGSKLTKQWESAQRRDPGLTVDQWLEGRERPPYVTDEEVARLAAGLAGRQIDVLISHGCPIGLGDRTPVGRRGGQRCFRDALEAVQPRLYLCGHLHLSQLDRLPDDRAVFNTGYGMEHQGWWIRWEVGSWEASPLETG